MRARALLLTTLLVVALSPQATAAAVPDTGTRFFPCNSLSSETAVSLTGADLSEQAQPRSQLTLSTLLEPISVSITMTNAAWMLVRLRSRKVTSAGSIPPELRRRLERSQKLGTQLNLSVQLIPVNPPGKKRNGYSRVASRSCG